MTDTYQRLVLAVAGALAIGATTSACGDDGGKPTDDAAPPVTVILKDPSRSSAIAITDDRAHVAMVNPDDGTLSVYQTSDNARTAKVATGKRPSGVVLAADGKTAYVANRDDATVVRVTGIDGGTPAVDATVAVGAEPVALALSPTGKLLFVAEIAQSRVSVIDTATMKVIETLVVDRPRALLVTNNADDNDADEQLIVPEFYGAPVAGREAKDDGRTGRVHVFSLADLTVDKPISLAPLDSGFHKGGDVNNPTVFASPNQLGSVAIAEGRIYVTSVSASPDGPARFDNNVFPVVHVADLATGAEVTGAGGTTNLARKIVDAIPAPTVDAPRFQPGDLADIAFVGGKGADGSVVAYTIGRAGDLMVRVTFGPSGTAIGSTQNKLIDLAGNDTIGKCQGPIGLAIDSDHGKAYVNCWVSRRLAVVDFAQQAMSGTFEGSPAAVGAAELSVARGKRFFFTGRARWSNAGGNGAKGGEGWSSCGSCHPDGLTDNMTWVFGAGPRQTTSTDGTFSHGGGAQKQRALNWTGIFDEIHDFERNTRDVSGGLGAITTAPAPTDCNALDKETQVSLVGIGGLAKPLKELADDAATATCGHKDWDDMTAYMKTIEPVHGKQADGAAIDRGKAAFAEGNCAKCHGGAGWTVSRVFYDVTGANTTALGTTAFTRPPFFPSTWMYDADPAVPTKRNLISGQPAIAADDTGPLSIGAGIGEIACSLRNVGTFGALDPNATAALELRPVAGGSPTTAEGRGGYNVPSLYGLAMGAPYLHHGQAPTLDALFSDARWSFHTNAGNANFSLALGSGTKLADLTAYLLSIDATTAEVAIPTDVATGGSFDACPAN